MTKFTKLLITIILTTSAAVGQELLSLDNAINEALEKNYSIKIAKSRQEIAHNDNTKGNAGMLPTVSGSSLANFTSNNINQEFFPVGTSQRPPLVQSGVNNRSTNSSINAVWTVYDGKGMYATAERLRELEALGKTNVEVLIENTVAQVSVAYYDIIRQKRRLKALQNALDVSKTRLDLAQANYEVGTSAKSDFLAAQVDYNADKATLVGQTQNIKNAKVNLNALLVRDLNIDFNVLDTIVVDRGLKIETLRANLLEQNPNLLVAKANKKVASIMERETHAARMPQIDLLSGLTLTTINNEAGFGIQSGRTGGINVGARLTVPIYDGYNQRRREQNAKINTIISQQQEADIELQLLSFLERTYNIYQNNIQLYDFEDENLKIARQNAGLAFERYRVGSSTAIEFREAQRNAIAAETRLIEAAYNIKIAEIEALRLSSSIIK